MMGRRTRLPTPVDKTILTCACPGLDLQVDVAIGAVPVSLALSVYVDLSRT